MTTSPKSVIPLLLFASISIVACKKDKAVAPAGDALFVEIGGGQMPGPTYKKLQITAVGSYEISITGDKTDIKQLPNHIQDSLKPYLSSFPRATIKADPEINKYGGGLARDMAVTTFTYVQQNPVDTTRIQIDYNTYVPYMEDYQKKLEQTMRNCKLLGN